MKTAPSRPVLPPLSCIQVFKMSDSMVTVELLQAMKDNNKAKRCSANTSSSVDSLYIRRLSSYELKAIIDEVKLYY